MVINKEGNKQMTKQIIAGGLGFVGRAVSKLFPTSMIYDKGDDKPINHYDYCHICVPTPANKDGSCDISIVEDVLQVVDADVYIIRSTIPPGTVYNLTRKYDKAIVFQPEYVASSSPYPAPLLDITKHPFIILGGYSANVKKVRRLYETVYPPTTKFIEMSSIEAEITKYMENSFIATYVTFCNEFYDICKQYEVDWDKVREGFLADPRMTPWWTYIYEHKRGWGGHCLPKDINAIIKVTNSLFLQDVVKNNERHKKENI
jgi:UDPglucose 6-dehydrogenase